MRVSQNKLHTARVLIVNQQPGKALSKLAFSCLLAVGLTVSSPDTGSAQNAPTSLRPPVSLTSPQGAQNPRKLRLSVRAKPSRQKSALGTGVEVDSLMRIDPDTAGVLSERDGGFGLSMWRGLSREYLETSLKVLPVRLQSPTLRNLMRRLLLSQAEVPIATGEASGQNASLVLARIKLLADMGDSEAVRSLLKAVPGRLEGEEISLIEVENKFLANDNARACGLVVNQIQTTPSAEWQKMHTFCLAMAGEHDKAALAVSLMSELGDEDELFFSLIEALASGKPIELQSLENPTPLVLAMLRVNKAQLPADIVNSKSLRILKTIGMNPNAPKELRLDVLERAEAVGAVPVETLRQLFASIKFSKAELASPLTRAETEFGPVIRALLYHTALLQKVPTARAEVISRALKLGQEEGRYGSTVRIFLPVIRQIDPTVDLLWFVSDAVRTLLIGGYQEQAAKWIRLLRTRAISNSEAQALIINLMPVARLMGYRGTSRWYQDALRNRMKADAASQTPLNWPLLFALYEALGDGVPANVWQLASLGFQDVRSDFQSPAAWLRLQSLRRTMENYQVMRQSEASESEVRQSGVSQSGVSQSDVSQSSQTVPGEWPTPTVDIKGPAGGGVGEGNRPGMEAPGMNIGVQVASIGDAPAPVIGDPQLTASRLPPDLAIGEVIILSLLTVGDQPLSALPPVVLADVVGALRAAGLVKEARSLAVEAILVAGL